MANRLWAACTILVLVAACGSPVAPTAPPTSSAQPTAQVVGTPSMRPTPTRPPSPSVAPTPTLEASATVPAATPQAPPEPTGNGALTVSDVAISSHLDALATIAQQNNGIRAAGTAGYVASADYVAQQLSDLGYTVERKPFDFTFFDETSVSLTVGDTTWTGGEWLHAMLYSAPGDVAGIVQTVGIAGGFATGTAGCDPGDWSGFTAGHIALIESGPCFRRDQVTLAQDAGAIGVIALYPRWEANQTRRPTLLDPSGITVPAIVAGREPTEALLAAAKTGGSVHIHLEVDMHPATVDNVLGEMPGSSDRIVMLGGHLDSVLDGPGINDNGSGVATLLAIAGSVALPARRPQQTVRFAFWGAEEFGDLGSAAYVRSLDGGELGRIDAYLNLDMVGSPNAARFVYDDATAPPGSKNITQQLMDALAAMGKPGLTIDIGPSSDHYAFEQAGIPSSGVFSGLNPLIEQDVQTFGGQVGVPADACYHLACDVLGNVNLGSAVTLGQAVATVLEQLAY